MGESSPPELALAPLSQQESPVAPLSQQESPVAPLSQWLQLMLAEIARKREEQERGSAEVARRASERRSASAHGPADSENPPLP